MSETHSRLTYMINQIARNFATLGDEAAAEAVADHIVTFWDPRMKAGILADVTGLSPIALAATEILRRHQQPPHATRATLFDTDRSDAG